VGGGEGRTGWLAGGGTYIQSINTRLDQCTAAVYTGLSICMSALISSAVLCCAGLWAYM